MVVEQGICGDHCKDAEGKWSYPDLIRSGDRDGAKCEKLEARWILSGTRSTLMHGGQSQGWAVQIRSSRLGDREGWLLWEMVLFRRFRVTGRGRHRRFPPRLISWLGNRDTGRAGLLIGIWRNSGELVPPSTELPKLPHVIP